MTSQPNTQIQTGERQLLMSRVFDAPRAVVFRAFSTSAALAQWWGPKGWTLPVSNQDFRPGGTWHYCMRGPGGGESWRLSRYSEIVEDERIVYTDAFSNAEGKVAEGTPQMQIRLEFRDEDGGTRVTSKTEFTSSEELKRVLDMGAVQGVTETWDRLEEYLESR
ncbi:MAG: SRPBCC domain-containing protein [Dehalococcoidia bacterium]